MSTKDRLITRSFILACTSNDRLTRYDDVQNLESSQDALLVFGNGDGGGGPLALMLENVSVLSLLLHPHLCLVVHPLPDTDNVDVVLLASSHPCSDEHAP
jgi:alpha-mannosidase